MSKINKQLNSIEEVLEFIRFFDGAGLTITDEDALIKEAKKLETDDFTDRDMLQTLYVSAKGVINNWESGDLAQAVRLLDEDLTSAREHLGEENE